MATARERYLNAVSPRAAASSEGVSPSAAANAEAAASVPPAPAAPSPRWSNRSSTAARTSELTSPAVTPRGAGRNAIASSPRAALSSSSANGRSPAVTSASAPTSTAAGNATAAAASPAAPSSNSYPKPMSGRKPGGSTGAAKSRAVEARLSAAMAIYAGGAAAPMPSPSPGTPGGGPVSDDDYFTDDGLLDPARVVSPRQMDVAAIRSPTNARNARLTGAAPPPTLGEIESHLLSDSHTTTTTTNVASPGARSTLSAASGGHRTRPMPENGMGGGNGGGGGGGGGRSHRKPGKKLGRGFFDESFEEAFPADDNLDAFNTSVDRGTSTTNNNQNPNLQKGRAAPSPSAQRKADRGAATGGDAQKALHDPFGTMPSLPTPTSSSSGGAAAAGHESTSVAARRRARAAATTGGLSIDTGLATSPTAAGHAADAGDATSPATMLDFALQGTPVAAAAAAAGGAGYPSDDDKEQEGVLGAVASPRSWKGASAAAGSGKVDTSREGLIGSDELSPSNAPTVMSDAEARLEEEERKRREAEEKKNRFLSKMILRVSCSQQQDG